MKRIHIFSIPVLTLFLYFSSAVEWSFNFPYYLLLGGIEESKEQPFKKFVEDYGYPLEVHKNVETEDGYILTLFRIPYGIKSNQTNVINRSPVLLVHGLLLSAEDWVVSGPEKSLGFILADSGYDIWMVNMRGSTHSKNHVKFNPTWNGKFWDFSIHELGYYDLAATVDYILHITNQKQLYYVGHSQGGSVFFILNSMRPEYNKRFRLMVALAPAVNVTNTKHVPVKIAEYFQKICKLINLLGIKEILPHFRLYSLLGNTICKIKGVPQLICKKLHFLGQGGISDHFNQSLTSEVMQYQYAGCSFEQIIHFGQIARYGRFCQYDYGNKKNLQHYGSEKPPNYDLTKVVVPIAYYYGKYDIFVVNENQKAAIKLFPNVVDEYEVLDKEFTHIDMVVGGDGAAFVYARALFLMKKY